jgi:PilZ domain
MQIERQSERLAIMWPIRYESALRAWRARLALCLNVGMGGMLLLLDRKPIQGEVLELHITDLNNASTRTLAKVRWIRPGTSWFKHSSLVGVKYLGADSASSSQPTRHD